MDFKELKDKIGKPQLMGLIIILLGVILGMYNRSANATDLSTVSDVVSCDVSMIEELGVSKDTSLIDINTTFTFFSKEEDKGSLIYDQRLLREVSLETVPFILAGNVTNVYYDMDTERVIYIRTKDPVVEGEDIKVRDLIFTLIDTVKLEDGYNYYINEFDNCKAKK